MAKQTINIGSAANDGTGTPARDAFDICNDNFTELYDGKLSLDGSTEMTGDLVFAEAADHSSTPGAGKGYLWVRSDTPSSLIFTDDAGTDYDLTDITSTPEGTAILSTGETGGTKFLREDGDGTCSWQEVAGGGAFSADAQTQITPTTPIVLDEASGDEIALDLSYQTNKLAGSDTGLRIAMTDTSSPGTSYPLDIQLSGATEPHLFTVDASGQLGLGNMAGGNTHKLYSGTGNAVQIEYWKGNTRAGATRTQLFAFNNAGGLIFRHESDISAGNVYTFNSGGGDELTDTDAQQAFIYVEPKINQSGTAGYTGLLMNVTETATGSGANNLLDLQVGSEPHFSVDNSKQVSLYNTYTDASNYERGFMKWNTNTLEIGTEAAGTGTARDLRITSAGGDIFIDDTIVIPTNVGVSFGNSSVVDSGGSLFVSSQSSQNVIIRVGTAFRASFTATSAQIKNVPLELEKGYTVATLPTASVGMITRVTDADTPAVGSTVTGGGAAAALCWYNGSNWVVMGV